MLGHRLRRCPSIKIPLFQSLVFAGYSPVENCLTGGGYLLASSSAASVEMLGAGMLGISPHRGPVKQNICVTLIHCRPNVKDAGPTLYKCYANVLCCWPVIQHRNEGHTHYSRPSPRTTVKHPPYPRTKYQSINLKT